MGGIVVLYVAFMPACALALPPRRSVRDFAAGVSTYWTIN
jgi:hypothetical protein